MQRALEAQRAELQATLIGAEPEQVLVFEVVGSVADFYRAVHRAGMEFLLEIDDEDAEPDDEFARENRPEEAVQQTLYLVLTNQEALDQLLLLWRRFLEGQTMPYGLTKFRDVFQHLRDIRPWGPQDRVAHTGVLEEWQLLRQAQVASVPVEIELWHRTDAARQAAAENAIVSMVQAAGGRVVTSTRVNSIAYHAILAELPPAAVDQVLSDGADAIAIARAGPVLFLRPVGQVAAPEQEGEQGESTDVDPGSAPDDLPPTVALFDGMPLEQHELLSGRLVVDDPDDWSSSYPADRRRHGTAMASLIIHGDLAGAPSAINRRLYVRPIMQPDVRQVGRNEVVPPDVLPVDLMIRSVRRMFEGEGTIAATAPDVRAINLSIGDPAAPFDRLPSPWARALDWLSWRYGVLFVVSAGNHPIVLEFPMPYGDLQALATDARRSLALGRLAAEAPFLRLLSPAESLNAITVGASHVDESNFAASPRQVDLIESGDLPSPISAVGRGIRRAVKPDVLLPGGRQLYDMVASSPDVCRVQPRNWVAPPGQMMASPSPPGSLSGTVFQRGTSNAAALATRLSAQLLEDVFALRGEPGGAQLDDEHVAVLLKAMLVHAADWQDGPQLLNGALPAWATRRAASRLLGYGHVSAGRIHGCPDYRATLLGTGTLGDRAAELRSFPLPPGLSGIAGRRRLTYTLAWMSPVNPRDKRYRRARMWCTPTPAPLIVGRKQVDDKAVRRGTVQHEIFEGAGAVPIVEGDSVMFTISCRADAGELAESVPYAIVASLEVAPELGVQVYNEVRTRVQPMIQVAPQP